MYYRRADRVEVTQGTNNLLHNRTSLPFRDNFVLLQVKVQVIPVTVFQYSAESTYK